LLDIARSEAAMLAHGVSRLLTFNPADFHRFDSVIEVVVP